MNLSSYQSIDMGNFQKFYNNDSTYDDEQTKLRIRNKLNLYHSQMRVKGIKANRYKINRL